MTETLPNSSITFRVDSVRTRRKHLPTHPMHEIAEHNLGHHVVAYSKHTDALLPAKGHGFVWAIHRAYAEHYPLSLSPDHVWLVICQGFARHMTLHGDVLNDDVMDFEDKKTLHVLRPDFRQGSTANDWEDVFAEFSQKIRQHIGDDLHRLLTPTFSTTTHVDKVAYEVSMMKAIQPNFKTAKTLCGIPYITLEGTPEDWCAILQRVRRFRTYNLRWWIDKLEPILQEFIYASEGNENQTFWQNMYKLTEGSGGPYITGWILKFFPYIGDAKNPTRNPYIEREPDLNKWAEGLTMRTIPSGLSSVDVRCDDGLNQWDISFVTGFFGVTQTEDNAGFRPEISWAVRDETAIKETLKLHRLSVRDSEEVQIPVTIRTPQQYVYVQFRHGKQYISDKHLWDSDGELSPILKKKKIKPDTWREVEYNHYLYRYDPEQIPHDLAITVIQTHEAKMTQHEMTNIKRN